jgi:hypothetical protein
VLSIPYLSPFSFYPPLLTVTPFRQPTPSFETLRLTLPTAGTYPFLMPNSISFPTLFLPPTHPRTLLIFQAYLPANLLSSSPVLPSILPFLLSKSYLSFRPTLPLTQLLFLKNLPSHALCPYSHPIFLRPNSFSQPTSPFTLHLLPTSFIFHPSFLPNLLHLPPCTLPTKPTPPCTLAFLPNLLHVPHYPSSQPTTPST